MKFILKVIISIIIIVLIGGLVMFFGLLNIDKSEPKIITLNSSIKMVGILTNTSMDTIFKDAETLGKKYKSVKDQNIIKHKTNPWAFVAISKNFTNQGNNWEYLMGDVVDSFNDQSKELISFEIPAGTYAVFKISPRFSFLWGPAIGLTKKFIYTEWLPESGYTLNNDIIGDFEYHDERSLAKKPMIELYVAIRPK